eukprot:CAMPEP_0113724536 /NCGR_PEP_ID=MMETSP0038_2-20120614/39146_1 /TAXON_ID=2898 /ORGANISM="Cryptomonas paramecium" /LENGTH=171 /DNA_ID=CAMNT_0000654473 /DNA_START=64 /DNA_END=580 /DNA_ORIENTATION=- /assembly_acc=CAM_ASM_000170
MEMGKKKQKQTGKQREAGGGEGGSPVQARRQPPARRGRDLRGARPALSDYIYICIYIVIMLLSMNNMSVYPVDKNHVRVHDRYLRQHERGGGGDLVSLVDLPRLGKGARGGLSGAGDETVLLVHGAHLVVGATAAVDIFSLTRCSRSNATALPIIATLQHRRLILRSVLWM